MLKDKTICFYLSGQFSYEHILKSIRNGCGKHMQNQIQHREKQRLVQIFLNVTFVNNMLPLKLM